MGEWLVMCKDVYSHGVNVREFNETHWVFIRNLTREENIEVGIKGNGGHNAYYKCKHCGEIIVRRKTSLKRALTICPNECNGVRYGQNSIVLRGVNDLATTHSHLIKYLVNKEDAHRYTHGSKQEVLFRCPDCGYEKPMKVMNLTRYHSCPICSDGISYPEKFVGGILTQLNIDFKSQESFDGNKTRYDLYIESMSVIIETHGIQHYESSRRGGRTLAEEQANDIYKKQLALNNGIKHYIVIDSRESTLEWMKQNIMDSELPTLLQFNETDIDWINVAEQAIGSLVKKVCDYFKNNGGSLRCIADIFKIGATSVSNYLKIGTQYGWCNYDEQAKEKNTKASAVKNGLANGKPIIGVNVKNGETVKFPSGQEAGRWVLEQGLSKSDGAQRNICSCANGKKLTAYGYKWSYL